MYTYLCKKNIHLICLSNILTRILPLSILPSAKSILIHLYPAVCVSEPNKRPASLIGTSYIYPNTCLVYIDHDLKATCDDAAQAFL